METASKHLDAPQILRKAQKLDASVDRSTVYRTLQLLKRHGLIDELDLMHINGEGHYYERKMNRDHSIWRACAAAGFQNLSADMFEKLKGQVERDCRFRIVVRAWRLAATAPRAGDPGRPVDSWRSGYSLRRHEAWNRGTRMGIGEK